MFLIFAGSRNLSFDFFDISVHIQRDMQTLANSDVSVAKKYMNTKARMDSRLGRLAYPLQIGSPFLPPLPDRNSPSLNMTSASDISAPLSCPPARHFLRGSFSKSDGLILAEL